MRSKSFLRVIAASVVVLLASCATAPNSRYSGMGSENRLQVVAKERHRLIEQYVDLNAISHYPRFGVPRVEVAADARGPGITESQSALIANNAGRALCSRLGKYVQLDEAVGADILDVHLVITAILPTGRAAAGASSVIGFFVPVPFRLPAGLGALAGEAEVRDSSSAQLAAMHWARGANAVTNSEKFSTIGDAWQLARQFGDQFARAVLDQKPKIAGIQHEPAELSVRAANRTICDQRFGKVNVAGRGVSFLLPLSPESIDAGAPPSTRQDAIEP